MILFILGFLTCTLVMQVDIRLKLKKYYMQGIRDSHNAALEAKYHIDVHEMRNDEYVTTVTVKNNI
jgi:hypothetical protein